MSFLLPLFQLRLFGLFAFHHISTCSVVYFSVAHCIAFLWSSTHLFPFSFFFSIWNASNQFDFCSRCFIFVHILSNLAVLSAVRTFCVAIKCFTFLPLMLTISSSTHVCVCVLCTKNENCGEKMWTPSKFMHHVEFERLGIAKAIINETGYKMKNCLFHDVFVWV